MSLEALNRAWKSTQPGTRKLVLLAIANVADEWGYAVTGGEYLASVCNVDLRSIRRHIKALVEAGELRRYKRGGGRSEANVYQVIIGLSPEEIALSETQSKIALEELAENGDKLSPFQPKNGDKMSPHTLNTAAVNPVKLINQEAAAINVWGDKMSLFSQLVDKFVRQAENGDKMSLFLQVGETALRAGWQGDVEELARLVVDAGTALDIDFTLEEALEQAQELGWRGNPDDLIRAWLQDPDRVENLLWYAQRKGWGAGLLRNALRSGEWPPELKPDSEAALDVWRRQAEWLAELQGEEDADV